MNYPIFKILFNTNNTIGIEQLGTKEKFWFYDENDHRIKLFKIGRPGTGENWAEKAAYELAKLLGLPCAEYEFGICDGKEGVISPLFVPEGGRLIHGNEILAKVIGEEYPKNKFYRVREHKLLTVLAIIKATPLLPPSFEKDKLIRKSLDIFAGYLLFDCWISNPDRHHENWGMILDDTNKAIYLAPTYDHASGLGCRVSDKERVERLNTNDIRYNIEAFVGRGKSAFYDKNLKQLKTIDAFFTTAKKIDRKTVIFWLDRLEHISEGDVKNIFEMIPKKLISKSAIDFALAILRANKIRLLELKMDLR